MTRRNFIALVSFCVLCTLGLIVVGLGVFATQSDYGQDAMRRAVEQRVRSSINGKIHLGRIHGNFLTGVTIDSLELRDDEDSLVVATGAIAVQYDPRDLVDRRLWFRKVDVQHPSVVLRQHENWKWNYRKLFKIGGPSKPKGPERGFGDFVILDSVHVHKGASFRLTIPWHADDSLHGARKDSAVRANIARKDHEIRRTREGLTQTYHWNDAYAFLPHIRISDPDTVGQFFLIDTLHVNESTPPFMWRNVRGQAFIHGDSAWMKATHFDLPGSTGSEAHGKIVWGSDLPVRYNIHIVGDSVSLADIAWVYPTLPKTGVGKMVLDIRNELNLNLLDYAIRDMDVRSTKSRLRGDMTFEVGGPVLAVHDVKLVADPVDFDLLRTLNGKPFPADWQGKLTGTVTARGGPLTHFMVDASDLTFRDAHVTDAVSHMKGHGELDILYPAFTAFHNFFASTDRLELRTLAAIYPSFPKMKGIVAGSAVLDSSWLDVRVSNADMTHTDGASEPSHATGGGRITYGIPFMVYDLTLQASPLSLTTVAQSYPKFPLRGVLSGPVRVRGTADDLDVTADLTGPNGHIIYGGKVDADSLGGYGAKGGGTFEGLDVAALFGKATPRTALNGAYDTDVLGDSLANLAGSVAVHLNLSVADSIGIARGAARLRFDRGVLLVDSARVESGAGVLQARGSLGLTRAPGTDSLSFAFDADSLGGLRRYLASIPAGKDTLNGALSVRGMARGWLDSLDLRGTLTGRSIVVNANRTQSVDGSFAMSTEREHVHGNVALHADAASLGGMPLDTASLALAVRDVGDFHFAMDAKAENGARLRTTGDWRAIGDTTRVRVDTLDMLLASSHWSLRRPSLFTTSPAGIVLDTLIFADASGGRIAGSLRAATGALATGQLVVDSLPLGDVGAFAQLPATLAGELSLRLNVAGTREAPALTLAGNARALRYGGLTTDVVTLTGDYSANRLSVRADVQRKGRSILDGNMNYPVAVTLFSAKVLNDSLRGHLHADSVDLALIEALSPKVKNSIGHLALDLAISGVPDQPHVGGRVVVSKGGIEVPDVGLKLSGIDGLVTVDPVRDSITVQRFAWTSPATGGGGSLAGSIVLREHGQPDLDLRLDAQNFRAVDKRGLARLDVSTGAGGLALHGTPKAATLTGSLNVDRGTIYIPELIRKQIVDLTPDEFAQLYDTTDVRNRSLMPQPPSALVEHLELRGVAVRLGEDVWLRSREASIKLGGSLNVTRVLDDRDVARSTLVRASRPDSARYKLALSGTLSADRGTYTLDLTAVQREFQVQSGRITFFGTPDFNPEIDVAAQYNVKQSNRSDIGIKARIHGNFYPQPQLDLSSTDAYLSPSDMVSYLVTGQPSFERTADVGTQQRAVDFLVPTVGASVGRALRDQLGGVVDLIQIQSGAYDPLGVTTGSQFRSILSSTRLGGEKQISDKLYFSFSTGLCQIGGSSSSDASQQGFGGFVNAIEGKLEYRFPTVAPDRLSLRAGREPPAAALRCSAAQVRGFVQTPEQWGFSLFRSWSF